MICNEHTRKIIIILVISIFLIKDYLYDLHIDNISDKTCIKHTRRPLILTNL